MNEIHLTDYEEDDSHGSTGQSDQHEELEPENQTLKGDKGDELRKLIKRRATCYRAIQFHFHDLFLV